MVAWPHYSVFRIYDKWQRTANEEFYFLLPRIASKGIKD